MHEAVSLVLLASGVCEAVISGLSLVKHASMMSSVLLNFGSDGLIAVIDTTNARCFQAR